MLDVGLSYVVEAAMLRSVNCCFCLAPLLCNVQDASATGYAGVWSKSCWPLLICQI